MKWYVKLALACVFILGLAGCSNREADNGKNQTNVKPTLYSLDEQKKELEKMPVFYDLAFSNDKQDSGTYVIPGLLKTETLKANRTGKQEISDEMDPQGITVAEDYVLISAYSHKKDYNSVIYVLDNKTHSYIKTVVLDGNPHVGGIIYDPVNQNIWVCNDKRNTSTARISSISLSDLKKYRFSENYEPIEYNQTIDLTDLNKASFIGYKNHALYIGDFSDKRHGKMNRYTLNEQGTVKQTSDRKIVIEDKPDQTYNINKEIQGVTFYENYILFSQSYGSEKSKILIYNDEKNSLSLEEDLVKEIEAPPYLEQIYSKENSLYAIFESGTKRFRKNNKIIKVDRVLQLDEQKVLN
ncbi:hypothetical protein [Enterococcus sp. DIV0660C]|uniref:YncE family protein n=1 Tax=Enterococcus sp. DIV0660C TaxID=2230880 RepID=UPI001A8FD2FF|nr:hypothetical protein [Enterococcus sp. DIV0660C]MBO0432642.1 hypothetical protein [Enterococcus sp. DIV0660C]